MGMLKKRYRSVSSCARIGVLPQEGLIARILPDRIEVGGEPELGNAEQGWTGELLLDQGEGRFELTQSDQDTRPHRSGARFIPILIVRIRATEPIDLAHRIRAPSKSCEGAAALEMYLRVIGMGALFDLEA